jgi:hypothetical protein
MDLVRLRVARTRQRAGRGAALVVGSACCALLAIVSCVSVDSRNVELAGSDDSAATGGNATGGTSASSGGAPSTGGSSATGGAAGKPGGIGGNGSGGGSAGGMMSGAGASGAGGAPGRVCMREPGDPSALLIDNLETGDGVLPALGGRFGFWYSYDDGTTTGTGIQGQGFTPIMPGYMSNYAAGLSGHGCTDWGAGMGFNFNASTTPVNTNQHCAYDLSPYTGVTLYAKSANSTELRLMIDTLDIESVQNGGTCTATSTDPSGQCDNYYGRNLVTTADWEVFTVHFTDMAQGNYDSLQFSFNLALGAAMKFQTANASVIGGVDAFDFEVDNISFITD